MSFLARLAARATGTSRAVEPRLRSRFEPIALSEGSPPLEIDQLVEVQPESASRETPNRNALSNSPGQSHFSPPLSRSGSQAQGPAANPVRPVALTGSPASRVEEARPSPALEGAARSDRSVSEPSAPDLGAAPTPAPSTPHGGEAAPPFAEAETAIPVEPAPGSAPTSSPASLGAAEMTGDQVFAAPGSGTFEPDLTLDRPPAATPRPAERVSHRAVRRRSDTHFEHAEVGVDDEPTVHVRIGRIEVRASTPASPAAKRSSRPPIESLDDYLRRTSGRR